MDGGLDADRFKLVSRPGEPAKIVNLYDFDYELEKKVYQIQLKATSKPLFSTAKVFIHVQDVNDNAPRLEDFMIIFNNFINHFPTEPIGRIPAFDPDVSDRDKLVYNFTSGNGAGFLHLNHSTGEIKLDSRLNSDVPRTGSFDVQVSDGMNDVTAKCSLYVRLVTVEMLKNSVTIRLNNMTASVFLSPLFNFFVGALAKVLHTDTDNVFVINVQNDTDVQAKILNVTVSVREKIKKEGRMMTSVFYRAEYLMEQIYLQRTALANMSYLQVLPFDDNLCVHEMCAGFQRCLSTLMFSKAAPFLTSNTMLFRPIHTDSGYRCICPDQGYTGSDKYNVCDLEVDLCYSNPCQHGGTCVRKEEGYSCTCQPNFAGETCQLNLTQQYDALSCPKNVCTLPSYCKSQKQGGFQCEGCPKKEDYNEFCQLTTRSFPRGSFLTFPALKKRYRFTITLRFATQESYGLLFYNGRFNEQHDFIALEIVSGQLQFSFSLGSNITKVQSYIEGGVNNGQWQYVSVAYFNRTVTLSVGEDCDTGISVRFGDRIGYNCATRVVHVIEDRCAIISNPCHRLLDLTGPLQIGGLPSLSSSFQIHNHHYTGCIKDFRIDGDLLDLNSSVANSGTVEGCPAKRLHCRNSPCRNGGSCIEGWDGYKCICPEKTGGMDCSQVIEETRKFSGSNYMFFSDHVIPSVAFVWFNGISFRTRSKTGVLMQIKEQGGEAVVIKLLEGYLTYIYTNVHGEQAFVMDSMEVNDGKWHYFEARWLDDGTIILLLDYGQRKQVVNVNSTLRGKDIDVVYVGAMRQSNGPIEKGFTGCLRDPRVGNTENSLLLRATTDTAQRGCSATEVCQSNPCPEGATCVDEWEHYTCLCPNGTMGPDCENICTNFNPCQNMADCRHPQNGHYTCDCGTLQSGRYCENTAKQPCPNKWWGYPVCGPCDSICTWENGFDPNCDKRTGVCSCRENFYKPQGSQICLPCDCYTRGSTGPSCDGITGQCQCIEGVIGRRCNQCPSKYAEIVRDEDFVGCRVAYEACPRVFEADMWWDSIIFGGQVIMECPNDAYGDARRNCSTGGLWGMPDLFNCTNLLFIPLKEQIEKIDARLLLMNTFVAKTLVADLANATSSTELMFGNDLSIAFQILTTILDYENQQSGLNLTSEQDSKYLSNLLDALSDVLDPKYSVEWSQINKDQGGTSRLIYQLETYLQTLLSALEITSQETPRPYSVVSDNIVLGVDYLQKRNFSGQRIPKYDNIVKNQTFDDDTNIFLPASLLPAPEPVDFLSGVIENDPKSYVGFIMYKTLGDLLPKSYGSSVRDLEERPMSVNSPVFSIIVRDGADVITGTTRDPVILTFKQLKNANRTSPQCVSWQNAKYNGEWSASGCTLTDRYELNGEKFVKCSCTHMTSFAILMDISDEEYVAAVPITLEVIVFIGLSLCMAILVVTFLIFFCFKRLQCNNNTIHINLVFVIFVGLLAFLIGVNRPDVSLLCRMTAISLHYFYMAGFSWLFVDILHLYRMMTEIRNIDQGSMKFYYLIGYVIPGIIVSLAVGLNTDGYGNKNFCWLSMEDKFIWSFAGPVTVAVIVNVFTFVLAVKASCREKISVSDVGILRVGLLANIVILLLWGISWVLGLLAVNFDLPALHYLYALFSCAIGLVFFLLYVVLNKKVQFELKKVWYRCKGKKLDLEENIGGTRSSVYSRSALAYHHNSAEGILNRINVGISTTSTTSHSTSKSSGGPFKGEDYLRSTSTSTSGNMPPVKYPKGSGLPPPYAYDPAVLTEKPDEVDARKRENDSDSDSELSVGQASLDLASSHSSDEDDEYDISLNWEKQLPKNKKIEEAKEQVRQKKKEKDEREKQNTPPVSVSTPPPLYTSVTPRPGLWPGDPQLNAQGSDSEIRSDQPTLSSVQPDVTLQTPEYKGRRDYIVPPVRTDSLLNDSNSSNQLRSLNDSNSSNHIRGPLKSPPLETRMKVQVLTHRGSISSDSECSHETSV